MAMNIPFTHGIVQQVLDWTYAKSINGYAGADSAFTLANNYLKGEGSLEQKVDSLIRWQVTKAATSGAVTGFGGFMTMPFTIPANVISVVYIQVRMIAAIAYMGGHDIRDDKVKSLIYISMAGNGAKELIKDMSLKATERVATKILTNISAKTVNAVEQKTGSKILQKIGLKSAANAGKIIPVIGSVVSATFDAAATKAVGEAAKKIFIKSNIDSIVILKS